MEWGFYNLFVAKPALYLDPCFVHFDFNEGTHRFLPNAYSRSCDRDTALSLASINSHHHFD